MRLTEFNKRFDNLKNQVTSMTSSRKKTTQDSNVEPKLPATMPVSTPAKKEEINWRAQKPAEWTDSYGKLLVGPRGLPAGWLDDDNKFVALTYRAGDMKELRQQLLDNRYNTPLYK